MLESQLEIDLKNKLFDACYNNNLDVVKEILENQSYRTKILNIIDNIFNKRKEYIRYNGIRLAYYEIDYCLTYAIKKGSIDVVTYLLTSKQSNYNSELFKYNRKRDIIEKIFFAPKNREEIIKILLLDERLNQKITFDDIIEYELSSLLNIENRHILEFFIFECNVPLNDKLKELMKVYPKIKKLIDSRELNKSLKAVLPIKSVPRIINKI